MQPAYSSLRKLVVEQLLQVKADLVLGLICVAGFAAAQLAAPWPLKIIFDQLLLDKPLPSWLQGTAPWLPQDKSYALVLLSAAMIGLAILAGTLSYLQIFLASRAGYKVVHRLRRDLFDHLQRLSLDFHSRARSGELLTKVTGDTNALREVFTESLLTLAVQGLTLLGMVAVMLALNWQLGMMVLATFPVLGYALYYVSRNVKKSASRQRRRDGQLAERIAEAMGAVMLVQSFGRERHESARFERASARSVDESVRLARLEAGAARGVEIIGAVGAWAVILFGSLQALAGRLTPGELLVFVAYVNQVYKPLRSLVKLSGKFSKAAVSAERIDEIMALEPKIRDLPDAIDAKRLTGKIVFDNVSFAYDNNHQVLEQVSFVIAAGERVALTGASGAGKSTLVSLLLRLYEPSAGRITIDDIEISHFRRESLRREIGVVLQDSLLLGATVRENIAYGKPDATLAEIENAARQARAHDFIMALPEQYETVLGERGATLSGGQRQRLALARALVKRPSILILDEPTSALDAESEALIWDALKRLGESRTILVVAHHLPAIQRCERILVLQEGAVRESRQADELHLVSA